MTEQDTREKLEADAMLDAKLLWDSSDECIIAIRGWLDRQADITKSECANTNAQRLGELHDLLDEAAREREKLREELAEWKHSHPLTPNQPDSKSDVPKSAETAENDAVKDDIRNFDVDTRELMAHECDNCEPMLAAEREIRELKTQLADWEKLTEGIELPSYPMVQFKPKDKDRLIADLQVECDELQKRNEQLEYANKLASKSEAQKIECIDKLEAERDELKTFCKRVEKAVRNGENLTLFGVDYVTAEQLEESCRKLRGKLRGQYEELLEDEKAENGWAREFLNRIGPKCGKPDCPSLVAYVEQLEAERDHQQHVIETQAESFRKLEAELSSMVRKYEEQKRRLSDKQQENANQREELARFNAVRRRTKRMPKACVWPRKDNGKLLKPGRDCMSITFYRDHYDVDYGDGEHLWCSFKVAREDERAWMRGED